MLSSSLLWGWGTSSHDQSLTINQTMWPTCDWTKWTSFAFPSKNNNDQMTFVHCFSLSVKCWLDVIHFHVVCNYGTCTEMCEQVCPLKYTLIGLSVGGLFFVNAKHWCLFPVFFLVFICNLTFLKINPQRNDSFLP